MIVVSKPLVSSLSAYNCIKSVVRDSSLAADNGQSRCGSKQSLLLSHLSSAPYTEVSARWRRKDGRFQHRRFSSSLAANQIQSDV